MNNKVWVNCSFIIQNKNKKLKPIKLGPYKILEKISLVTYKIIFQKVYRIELSFMDLK